MQILRKSNGAKVEIRFHILAQFYVLEQLLNLRFIFPFDKVMSEMLLSSKIPTM